MWQECQGSFSESLFLRILYQTLHTILENTFQVPDRFVNFRQLIQFYVYAAHSFGWIHDIPINQMILNTIPLEPNPLNSVHSSPVDYTGNLIRDRTYSCLSRYFIAETDTDV